MPSKKSASAPKTSPRRAAAAPTRTVKAVKAKSTAAKTTTAKTTTAKTTTAKPRVRRTSVATAAPSPIMAPVFTHHDIALRAHDLYVQSGYQGHREVEFWLEAERQLRDGFTV